jgi:hypothetical protein
MKMGFFANALVDLMPMERPKPLAHVIFDENAEIS